MVEKLFNVRQVQEMLGLSERTIFRLIKNGELNGFKVGREWRFQESDLEAYIALQRRLATQARLNSTREPQEDKKLD